MKDVTITYDPADVNFGDFDPCFYSLRDEFVEKLRKTLKDQIAIYCSAHLHNLKTYPEMKLDNGELKVFARLDSNHHLFDKWIWELDPDRMEIVTLEDLLFTCFENLLETKEGTDSVVGALESIIHSIKADFAKWTEGGAE